MKSAEAILLQVQLAQQEHDQKAHRDILNLDTQTRLKHMTLHFLKYAGKIVCAREERDHKALANILVDTFIICLATANALNVSLGAEIHLSADNLQSLSIQLGKRLDRSEIFDHALSDLVKISGRMAKSIESTDHLERGNPRAELEKLIVDLTSAMLACSGALGVPMEDSIRERWSAIEAKSIFARAALQ